jgi:transcriptional regulator
MSSPKPALGFRSRTEAIIVLRSQGLSTQQIATRLEISTKNVTALECSTHRSTKAEQHGRPTPNCFPLSVRQRLRPHAIRRGTSVDRLISEIVAAVAENGLVDAVLDDGAV